MEDSITARPPAPARAGLRFRKSMMPVFAGLTAALLALGLVIGNTTVAQREARTRAMNEGDVLLALNDVMTAALDAETGQRGYLLTGKPDYLVPYVEAKQRRSRAMARLREVSRKIDDIDLPGQLDRLDATADAKFGEMDRTVALMQAGFKDQALALVQADFGKLQMDAIRGQIADLNKAGAQRRGEAFERAGTLERRLLPLIGVLGFAILALVYAGFRAERNRSLAEGEAEQAAALRDANARIELLARELNHRVKNLFSVILSIVALSGRKQASSGEVVDDIRARIRALSLAHSASQGGDGDGRTALGLLIVRTMEPYADDDDDGVRVRVNGPQVELPLRMVTPIGLIIHELATNAVKYGALSVEGGTVDVSWEIVRADPDKFVLALNWIENGGPPIAPEAAGVGGFGSQMTKLAAGQLGGTIEREWPISGAVARLRFPLP